MPKKGCGTAKDERATDMRLQFEMREVKSGQWIVSAFVTGTQRRVWESDPGTRKACWLFAAMRGIPRRMISIVKANGFCR